MYSSARIKVTVTMMNAADEWMWEVANWVSSAFLFSIRVPPVIQKKLTLALVLEDLSANKTQLRQTQRKTESPTKVYGRCQT